MPRKVVSLGSTQFSPFNASSGSRIVSNYTPTSGDANLTGAVGSSERPIRITSIEVFWRSGSGGSVDLKLATNSGGTGGYTSGASNATGGSSSSATSNYATFVGDELFYGFSKNNSTQTNFFSGSDSGKSIFTNGATSFSGRAIRAELVIDTVPSAPNGLSASPSQNSVFLSWSAPSDTGGSTINGYRVLYKTSSQSSWTFGTTTGSSTTQATISGLTQQTNYSFLVAATNGVSNTHNSSYTSQSAHTGSNASFSTVTTAPALPSTGTITAVTRPSPDGRTQITVEWSTTNNATTTRASGPGITASNANSGSVVATGLSPDTAFTYTLTTNNAVNASSPDVTTASARTLLAAPTMTIEATALTSTTARVVWSTTNATSSTITGTNLNSSALSGNEIVTGLTRNTIYRWSGVATNSDGNSGTVQSNSIQTPNVIGGVWTGTQFAFPTVRVWVGSSWEVKESKVWTGSNWKIWA